MTTFPRDILLFLFSLISLIQDFANISLINRLFNRLIPDLSRILIRQYFPYLEQTKKKEYALQPKILFLKEFHYYRVGCFCPQSILFGLDIKLVLFALKGEMDKIAQNDKNKQSILYCLAAANGSRGALAKLDPFDKELALQWAAKNGYLTVVQWLLENIATDNKQAEDTVLVTILRGWALLEAAKYGHLDVLKCLAAREKSEIFAHYKVQALKRAVKNGHLGVVEWLITQLSLDHYDFKELSYLAFECQQLRMAIVLKKYQWQVEDSQFTHTFTPQLTHHRNANNVVEQEIEQLSTRLRKTMALFPSL